MLQFTLLLLIPVFRDVDPGTAILLVLVAAAAVVLLKLAAAFGDAVAEWVYWSITDWRNK